MSNPFFHVYKVYFRRSNGQVDFKKIDAVSSDQAENDGRRYGRVLRTVKENSGLFRKFIDGAKVLLNTYVPSSINKYFPWNRGGFSKRERVEFLLSLSNVLRGAKLTDALSLLSQNFSGSVRDVCRKLRYQCAYENKDLIEAIRDLGPRYIPGVTLTIIAINHKVSSLDASIREGLNFEKEMAKLESGYIVKAIWSIAWFWFAAFSLILTDVFGWQLLNDFNYFAVMPESGSSVDKMNLTRDILHWSSVAATIVFSMWFLAFLVFAVGRDISPAIVERWILKVPVLRGTILNRNNFVATYQVAKLLSKGVPQIDAFRNVSKEFPDGVLKRDFERVIGLLEEGSQEWVDGFYSFGDLDRALLKSSNNAEEIAEVFDAQSNQFLYQYQRSIDVFSYIHHAFTTIFTLLLSYVLVGLMFLPMVGGFEVIDQM